MKSKFLLIPAVLLGVTALGGAAVGLAHNSFARSAKAEESCYAITDSMYDVAFFEQYNDVANCISVEDYSYANDKPIGSNSIGVSLLLSTVFETSATGARTSTAPVAYPVLSSFVICAITRLSQPRNSTVLAII